MISTLFSLVRRLYIYNQKRNIYFNINNDYVKKFMIWLKKRT